MRRSELIVSALIPVGAVVAGAGAALYFSYPIRVEVAAGAVRGDLLSLNPAPGSLTTQRNADYKAPAMAAEAPRATPAGGLAKLRQDPDVGAFPRSRPDQHQECWQPRGQRRDLTNTRTSLPPRLASTPMAGRIEDIPGVGGAMNFRRRRQSRALAQSRNG
jgi:hypothetical protein